MKSKQFIINYTLKLGKGKVLQLSYTIVMIDKKVVRIFNHTTSKKGNPTFHTIEPSSDMFSRLKKRYEDLYAREDEQTLDAMLKVI